MRSRSTILVLALVWGIPLPAQVDKIAIRTTGISCGVCAVVSEVAFRRIPDIDHVSISLSKESILLSYRRGGTFSIPAIRKVLDPLHVGILELQIRALGNVREERGKRLFAAGKDTFVLTAGAAPLPLATPVFLEAILEPESQPMGLKVLKFTREIH
jgi:hypothetical protein